MSEGSIEIKDLIKTYTDDRGRPTFTAVKNISLPIQDGEFMGPCRTVRLRKIDDAPDGCRLGKKNVLR